MNQRLFRSRDDRVIAGVAGGLAAMLNVDPSLVRILWVILVPLTGGFIILLYFVMAVVVPELPIGEDRWQTWDRPWPDPWANQGTMGEPAAPSPFDAATSETEAMGLAGAAGAAGAPGAADATGNLGDDATRRYPPAGTIPDLGAAAPLTAPIGPSATSPGGTPAWTSGRASAPAPGPGGGTEPLPGGWQPPTDARRSAWQTPGEESRDRGVPLIFGLILVLIGAFFLARSYIPGIDWEASWPFLLVGIGIALLLGSLRRSANRP